MTTSEAYPFGARVRVGRTWYTVTSTSHPHRRGCYVWRDGGTYSAPELVNWREERRVVHAPPPPDDPPPRYVTVPALP